MLRDLVLLSSIRWMFRSSIFHFHAAGTSELYSRLPTLLRLFYRLSYFKPDVAIQLSEFNPDDASALQARKTYLIPNGIEDDFAALGSPTKQHSNRCTILWVGLISDSKGFLVLVDALRILAREGITAHVTVVGSFDSDRFKERAMRLIASHGLYDVFEFTGALTGRNKFERFLEADIFCFPTFFESESFGLVVLEAMQFGLPTVASRWRGVQSLVKDGETGYLVQPRDAEELADRLGILVRDPELRVAMGQKGRSRFLRECLVDTFYARMDECFADV
jgi:glycosyltransferase involved in cell wall biosynthesis